jgi:bifunctional non-homologous end joining protein LigD
MTGFILFAVQLPKFQPLPLTRKEAPFTHRDWVFELKWDGFRSLVYIDGRNCRLVSRNGNEFKSFPDLNKTLPFELTTKSAVLDAEIVCVDHNGRSQFKDLLFHRGDARVVAFDVLSVEGEDLRHLPRIERKWRLRSLVQPSSERLLYCDHVESNGEGLFCLACEYDLEGIVAKRKFDPYISEHGNWLKIRNRDYSQWVGREELFERKRERNPELIYWDNCARALDSYVNQ